MTELKSYPAYKDSGMPWLGCLQERWKVRRLRGVTQMLVSNIDKHSTPGEAPVRLCNYIDVYKNERITDRLPFMQATASRDEADAFRLETGDVVITKDSEEWDDIAVPALVEYAAPDLVCGYHLAILRPRNEVVSGPYLARALQAPCIAHQFYVAANGVTRYGLSHDAIKSALVTVPPLFEQAAIVRYLDHADRKVRRAIRARQQLIKLLTEQKQAIIQRAVTRGLDPNVRLKPSGAAWLGDVPQYWEVLPLKRVSRVQGGYAFSSSLFDDHGVPIVRMTNLKSGRLKLAGAPCIPESECMDRFSARAGDLLYGLSGSIGNFGVVQDEDLPVQINQRVGRFVPLLSRISGSYLALVVQTPEFSRQVLDMCTGTAQLNVSPLDVERVVITVPSLPEQTAILAYVHDATAILDKAIDAARREIDLLREYRTRLIADVVTGKLDVRDVTVSDDETDVLPE